jgi:hypothetical protein
LPLQIGDVVQPGRRRTRASSNGLLVQLELDVSIYNAAEARSCWVVNFGGCVPGILTEICIRYDKFEVDENMEMLLGVNEKEKESEPPRMAGGGAVLHAAVPISTQPINMRAQNAIQHEGA